MACSAPMDQVVSAVRGAPAGGGDGSSGREARGEGPAMPAPRRRGLTPDRTSPVPSADSAAEGEAKRDRTQTEDKGIPDWGSPADEGSDEEGAPSGAAAKW